MNEAVTVAIITSIASSGLISGWFALRQSRKAADTSLKLETMRLEADGYKRARASFKDAIDELDATVERMRQDQGRMRQAYETLLTQFGAEQSTSDGLRQRLNEAERHINDLQRTINWMRSRMLKAGLDVLTIDEPTPVGSPQQ
jgi:chromosome segregation ATPase